MNDMRNKSPRTYRKLFPGQYVICALIVTPDIGEMLIEGPVSHEVSIQVTKLLTSARGLRLTEPPKKEASE